MASTIHDVAKLAGVHPSTVSRALSGKASITDETKERIHAAMKQLDYHPSALARSLATGLTGAISLVVDAGDPGAFSNVFFSHSLLAIERVAHARGYSVIIVSGGKGALSAIEGLVLGKKADGLILPPSVIKSKLIERIGSFPFVVLGQPDALWPDASWVDNNNEQGAQLAVRHLRDRGYRRIAYLGGDARLGFVRRRLSGYRASLNADEERVFPAGGTLPETLEAAERLLAATPAFDAVLCNDNLAALGLLRAAQRAGRSVPGDLGVVTFDREPFSEFTDPPLTCVDIDTAALGEQAAELLFQHIEQGGARRQVLLGVTLIPRQSTDRM